MNIRVYRIRQDAKLPVRAHSTDAGADLFYCPDRNRADPPCDRHEDGTFHISPGASCILPTGIKVEIPKGHMLEIKNKSGIASKQQLLVGACVVDAGYNGEVFVNLHNIGNETKRIAPGQKIAQAVLEPIVTCGIEEAKYDTLNYEASRGEGGFGSTGLS